MIGMITKIIKIKWTTLYIELQKEKSIEIDTTKNAIPLEVANEVHAFDETCMRD